MSDKELLELAAKACGYKYIIVTINKFKGEDGLCINGTTDKFLWNPLTNKANCLQMEIVLKIGALFNKRDNVWVCGVGSIQATHKDRQRASIMVAAQIGMTK